MAHARPSPTGISPVISDELMNKDKLREILQQRTEVFLSVYGGEIVRCAAEPVPKKRPWRQRKSLLDESFEKALAEEEARQQKEAQKAGPSQVPAPAATRSALDDADAVDMSPS